MQLSIGSLHQRMHGLSLNDFIRHYRVDLTLGRYVHQADSYHIYGSYLEEFQQRFLKMRTARTFEERTYRYEDVKFMMDEAVEGIMEKVSKMS